MKNKKILKLLKKEVNSITPDNYNQIKAEVLKIEQQNKNVKISNESLSVHKKWLGMLASCMIIIVAVVGASIPIILSDTRAGGTLGEYNPPTQQEQVEDETTEDNNTNSIQIS